VAGVRSNAELRDWVEYQMAGKETAVRGGVWGGYPGRFVNLQDRYIFWGEFDLHKPLILNKYETILPWVAIRPKRLKKGEGYSFNIVFRSFPSPPYKPRDRLNWYAENMYSSDPFFKEEPPKLTHTISRTFPEGNIAFYTHALPLDGPSPSFVKMEDRLLKLGFTNLVLMNWYGITDWLNPERKITQWAIGDGKVRLDPRLKRFVKRLQRKGFRVYLWFWPVTLSFDPGHKDKLMSFIDFIKRVVMYTGVDGVGYDMNWHGHKEILKIQYEIYRWLKKEFKEKKYVLVDYGFGTPSALYTDFHLSEFGLTQYGYPENPPLEGAMAFRVGVANIFDYPLAWERLKREGEIRKYGIMRGINITTEEELKKFYLEYMLKAIALGGSWALYGRTLADPDPAFRGRKDIPPFLELMELKELASFSARVTGTPLVAETQTMDRHPDLIASTWAKKDTLLIAAYRYRTIWHPEPGFFSPRQEAETKPVWINLSREILAKYGLRKIPELEVKILGKDALPIEEKKTFQVKIGERYIKIKGILFEGETLLISSKKD